MCRIAFGFRGQQSRIHDAPGQLAGFLGRFKQREVGHKFKSALGHFRFTKGNFIKHKLTGEKFVIVTFQFPPVFGHLLACGLQEVAGRTRNNVAGNSAFDLDTHDFYAFTFSSCASSASNSRRLGLHSRGLPYGSCTASSVFNPLPVTQMTAEESRGILPDAMSFFATPTVTPPAVSAKMPSVSGIVLVGWGISWSVTASAAALVSRITLSA